MNAEALPAPVTDSEWDYLCKRRFDIKVRTLTNRLYQQERQRIMERREGLMKAASLVAGSVAFASIVDPSIVKVCVAVIFLGTAGSLVFGWGTKARDAAKRAAEWIGIDRDIDKAGARRFTEVELDDWAARCNEVEAGEPAPNPALLERSFQRACESLGCDIPAGRTKVYMGWRPMMQIP